MKNFFVLVIMALVALSVNAFSPTDSDATLLATMRDQIMAHITAGASNCVFEDRNFSNMNGKVFSRKDATNHYTYELTMCSQSKNAECDGSICQYGGDQTYSIGSFVTDGGPTWSWTEAGNKNAGVKAHFANGGRCAMSTNRITDVFFTCASAEKVISAEETKSCSYEISIAGPGFCAGGSGGGSYTPPAKKKEDDGLSGGAIFLIVLMSVSIAYVVIGCIVCWKKYNKRGLEACPHKAFWFALPGLTKDGCIFTYGKLRNLCGSKTITTSSGDYESA